MTFFSLSFRWILLLFRLTAAPSAYFFSSSPSSSSAVEPCWRWGRREELHRLSTTVTMTRPQYPSFPSSLPFPSRWSSRWRCHRRELRPPSMTATKMRPRARDPPRWIRRRHHLMWSSRVDHDSSRDLQLYVLGRFVPGRSLLDLCSHSSLWRIIFFLLSHSAVDDNDPTPCREGLDAQRRGHDSTATVSTVIFPPARLWLRFKVRAAEGTQRSR